MDAYAGLIREFIQTAGAPGAILAGVIVGLGLLIIIYAKSAGMFALVRTEDQKGDLLDHFAEEVERLAGAEQELRRDLARNEAEQDRLKDKQRELETKVVLMRAALRRAVDLLRAVREGRLAPDAIEAIDTIEASL